MIIRKVNLVKKANENIFTYHPVSSSDVIMYDDTLTVKEVLDAIVDSVEQVENRLQGKNVYMKDSNGTVIQDESGTGLVEIL